MFINLILIGYSMLWFVFGIFTWGFADANLPFKTVKILYNFVNFQRSGTLVVYSFFILAFFLFYGLILWQVARKNLTAKHILILIISLVLILLFSFPAFSYDIFNYIATAKVTFIYKENPYIVMPIEIPGEPLLAFMHAANKTALYGPAWIALTGISLALGFNNLLLTIFTFKIFILLFYFALLWVIWRLSNKSLYSLAFFALNPLVIYETLISLHNDVVMMSLVLLSFYFFGRKKKTLSLLLFTASVLIKFATLALLPIYLYLIYIGNRRLKISWQKIWLWSTAAMYTIFALSPLREEIYSWYLIWPLVFVSLLIKDSLWAWLSFGFSFGLLFRITPFIYWRDWGGATPLIKKIVTFVPPLVISIYYEVRKKI